MKKEDVLFFPRVQQASESTATGICRLACSLGPQRSAELCRWWCDSPEPVPGRDGACPSGLAAGKKKSAAAYPRVPVWLCAHWRGLRLAPRWQMAQRVGPVASWGLRSPLLGCFSLCRQRCAFAPKQADRTAHCSACVSTSFAFGHRAAQSCRSSNSKHGIVVNFAAFPQSSIVSTPRDLLIRSVCRLHGPHTTRHPIIFNFCLFAWPPHSNADAAHDNDGRLAAAFPPRRLYDARARVAVSPVQSRVPVSFHRQPARSTLSLSLAVCGLCTSYDCLLARSTLFLSLRAYFHA